MADGEPDVRDREDVSDGEEDEVPQRQVQNAPQLIPRPPAANGRPPQWQDLDPHFTVDAYLDYFFLNFRTCYFTHTAYTLLYTIFK